MCFPAGDPDAVDFGWCVLHDIDAFLCVFLQVTQMLLTVVGVSYMTWLPFCVMAVTIGLLYRSSLGLPPDALLITIDVCRALLNIGPPVNCLIYASRNRRFRLAYMKILKMKQ